MKNYRIRCKQCSKLLGTAQQKLEIMCTSCGLFDAYLKIRCKNDNSKR